MATLRIVSKPGIAAAKNHPIAVSPLIVAGIRVLDRDRWGDPRRVLGPNANRFTKC